MEAPIIPYFGIKYLLNIKLIITANIIIYWNIFCRPVILRYTKAVPKNDPNVIAIIKIIKAKYAESYPCPNILKILFEKRQIINAIGKVRKNMSLDAFFVVFLSSIKLFVL